MMPRVPDRLANRDLDYVFVLTYGRSGSTLVMGILNSIPGYLIRGENQDALRHLYRFHTTMTEAAAARPKKRSRMSTDPHFGIADFPQRVSLNQLRRLALATVLRPKDETRVTGFKEIKWTAATPPEAGELASYVAWLRRVFPGARFVVNTRDHQAVLASRWWARGDKSAALESIETEILAVAEDLGDAAYRIHFDDYVADPESLRGLFGWLGEEFDAERVTEVMAVKHSV